MLGLDLVLVTLHGRFTISIVSRQIELVTLHTILTVYYSRNNTLYPSLSSMLIIAT
jgi:hypothetical protein